jgi:hypothetical protein
MLSERKESIKKLKKAVKNKTLLMYQDHDGDPRYYDNETNSCCAVGAILPLETLFEYMNRKGDVNYFTDNGDGDYDIETQLGDNTQVLYGMEKNELMQLQTLHDKAMSGSIHGNAKRAYKSKFEQYVKSLK